MKNCKYFYVDAHAGAGKTYAAHDFITSNSDRHFVIATQTNALSNQQCIDLRKLGRDAHVISRENAITNCTKRFIRHCKESAHIIPLVHQSVALQELDGTEEHHLIVDEYPSPVQKIVLKEDLASGQRALSSILCTARKTECDGYVELTSNSYVKEISDDSAKSVSMFKESKNLRKVCRYIESPHWRVIVHEKEFNGLASFQDSQRSGEGKYFSLTVYVLMQPSVLANYASVTFMGANFTRSKLYLAWRSIV